ncbi:uncharacterized protein LOC18769844 isoform X2 [Prunus persica]|uniref:uncharacterized protein LOC18769844 isoform X1 n=1 Tax=Prunus persica TaxID=3760 RepID=UPI0009AB2732|nr:uncharacterized protein LOC18769844 isoform X1 [Prunus persica]XP_020424774.1 uncharacterized protein LOC18769844 isoform X2 [Prunus persica]
MPGTILVSVLEFMDLPSSSSSSSISIKVSMGKRECQTWDKGDFTFPLTTLRDNLVVLLQDAEGNEILDAGVETKSIVEKGLWDAFFSLKGGGLVHMKLQFVLNEEERIRIRLMRESALKRKLGEFIYSNPSSVQITPGAGTNLASSLCLPNEISDRNEETSSGITLHQRVDLPLTESCQGKLVEETEAQPLPANVPAKAKYASESSKLLRSPQSMVRVISLPNLQEDKPHNLEKQGPIQKTPSNVKKMISTFESGSAEDMRPCIKPPPKEVQSNSIKAGAPLKFHNLKEDKKVDTETAKSILEGVLKSFSSGDLLLDPTSGDKSGEQINLLGASDGTKSSHPTGIKNKVKQLHVHQEVGIKKNNFHEDFITTSTFETVQVSEKILSKHRHQPSNTRHGRRNSGSNPVIEESRLEISSTNISQIIDIQEASTSADVCTSVVNCEDRHIPYESSGAWIFPDEAIRFCITTSGKKFMDLLGGCREKPNIQQGRMNVSLPENSEEQNVKNHRPRKSKVDHPEEAETSGGKVGQAIKVAIMIGFGTLVLLTRQRKNR